MIGPLWQGARAALMTPLWLSDERLASLLTARSQRLEARQGRELALRAALAGLRRLARLPFSPWRYTCLYRSVAATLVLRRYGVDAQVRLGVTSANGVIGAHAWVEGPDGRVLVGDSQGHEQLLMPGVV